jgi:hypothetical protein
MAERADEPETSWARAIDRSPSMTTGRVPMRRSDLLVHCTSLTLVGLVLWASCFWAFTGRVAELVMGIGLLNLVWLFVSLDGGRHAR